MTTQLVGNAQPWGGGELLGALDALTRATLQDEFFRIWEESRKTVVMVTNDPDEGIYLADRIIPLTAGSGATLGPSFRVDLPRPRERKAVMAHPDYCRLHEHLIEFLEVHAHRKPPGAGVITALPSRRRRGAEADRPGPPQSPPRHLGGDGADRPDGHPRLEVDAPCPSPLNRA